MGSTVGFHIYVSRTSAFSSISKSASNLHSTETKPNETAPSPLLHQPTYLTSQCLPHILNHNHTSHHLRLKNTIWSHHLRSQHTHARCTNTPRSRWRPPLDQHEGGVLMLRAQTHTAD